MNSDFEALVDRQMGRNKRGRKRHIRDEEGKT